MTPGNYIFIELSDTRDKTRHVNVSHIVAVELVGTGTSLLKIVLSNGKSFKVNLSMHDFDRLITDSVAYYENEIIRAKNVINPQ